MATTEHSSRRRDTSLEWWRKWITVESSLKWPNCSGEVWELMYPDQFKVWLFHPGCRLQSSAWDGKRWSSKLKAGEHEIYISNIQWIIDVVSFLFFPELDPGKICRKPLLYIAAPPKKKTLKKSMVSCRLSEKPSQWCWRWCPTPPC